MGIDWLKMGKKVSSLARFPLVYNAWQAPFLRQKLRPLLEDPDCARARRILDVGCGPGINAALFSGRDYLGLDLDEKMIAAARRDHGDKFVVGSAVDYPFREHGLFDLILVNSLFHHLTDAESRGALDNLRGVLAPGGAVHILDLVLPPGKGVARALARLDRGAHARPLEEWRRLFSGYFEESAFRPYALSFLGVPCYRMVYFKGASLRRRSP